MSSVVRVVLGTRGSRLAQWQTRFVVSALERHGCQVETVTISTRGDAAIDRPIAEVGGKGVFTEELEAALREGGIDAAVHSLKDLPTEPVAGLVVGAIPGRADARDTLVSADGSRLAQLPNGARVGTSSARRRAQLLFQRPELKVEGIRGNVETRVAKVDQGDYAATVLAAAGLTRLEMGDRIAEWFEPSEMTPAPGQGALAVQCRDDDRGLFDILSAIDDDEARAATTAERSLLAKLDGGCSAPIGAFAVIRGAELELTGRVSAVDGSDQITVVRRGPIQTPVELGAHAADELRSLGAAQWL